MQQQYLDRFVGIPYKFLGIDYDGVDCIGLCQLFYFEHGICLEWRDYLSIFTGKAMTH